MYTNKIVTLANKLSANFEGCTLNLESKEPQTTRHFERYIFGGFSDELKFKFCPANKRGQIIFDYIEKNKSIVESKNLFFGIWFFEGFIYLDVCKAYNNRTKAIRVAKEKNELAIFDNLEKTEITINH